MEKKAYSVEWLSESSHRNTTYPSVDLLACRSGTSTLQYQKDLSTQGMERPSTATSKNEKENPFDLTAALYHVQRTQAEAHDVTTPRKVLKEVFTQNPCPASEECPSPDGAKSPESLSEDDATSRPRTKFSDEQLRELETSFREQKYIGSNEKKRLSRMLNLSETQIKTWFQNRRMKFKRQNQDARVEAYFSGLYVPNYGYSDFQTPACPIRPGLAMALAPPAPIHPFAPLSATVIRPGNHPSSMTPANLGPYRCPSVLVHPSYNEPVGLRFSPY